MRMIRGLVVSGLLGLVCLVGMQSAHAQDATSSRFAFQGVVTDVPDGDYITSLTFTGGTQTSVTVASVPFRGGVFTVVTPSGVNPLSFWSTTSNQIFEIAVNIDTDTNVPGYEYTFSNIPVSTVPVAFVAHKAMTARVADSATAAGTAVAFSGSLAGDVTGTQTATSVGKLKGSNLNFTSLSGQDGKVLKVQSGEFVLGNAGSVSPATTSALGGIIVGDGLSVDGSGLVAINFGGGLDISSGVLGAKVSAGLGINGSTGIFVTPADASNIGGVKVPSSSAVSINGSGQVDVKLSSQFAKDGAGVIGLADTYVMSNSKRVPIADPDAGGADQNKFLKVNGSNQVEYDYAPVPNPMTGADGTNAGNGGLVPVPTATDNVKFLRGDATWASSADGLPVGSVLTTVDGTAPTANFTLMDGSSLSVSGNSALAAKLGLGARFGVTVGSAGYAYIDYVVGLPSSMVGYGSGYYKFSSDSGGTWNDITDSNITSGSWSNIYWLDDRFVATRYFSGNTEFSTSTDGTSWSTPASAANFASNVPSSLVKTSSGYGAFAPIGGECKFFSSSNGTSWSGPGSAMSSSHYCGYSKPVSDGAGTILYGISQGGSGKVMVSTNSGSTWSQTLTGVTGDIRGAYNGTRFCLFGKSTTGTDVGYYSDNGTSWQTMANTGAIAHVPNGDRRVVAVGDKFVLVYSSMSSGKTTFFASTDCSTWSRGSTVQTEFSASESHIIPNGSNSSLLVRPRNQMKGTLTYDATNFYLPNIDSSGDGLFRWLKIH